MTQLPSVPEDVSALSFVKKYWPTVISAIFDGYPTEGHLSFVESQISQRKALVDQNMLDPAFDWAADLNAARSAQEENLRWIPTHQATRQGYVDFWRSATIRLEEYSEKLAISGMNLIVGFHGAVALGAIKVLSDRGFVGKSVIEGATWALPFAVIGIISFAIGKFLAFHESSKLASELKVKLINPKNTDFEELASLVQRTVPVNNYATYLIYGSLFWFVTYSIVLMLILIE